MRRPSLQLKKWKSASSRLDAVSKGLEGILKHSVAWASCLLKWVLRIRMSWFSVVLSWLTTNTVKKKIYFEMQPPLWEKKTCELSFLMEFFFSQTSVAIPGTNKRLRLCLVWAKCRKKWSSWIAGVRWITPACKGNWGKIKLTHHTFPEIHTWAYAVVWMEKHRRDFEANSGVWSTSCHHSDHGQCIQRMDLTCCIVFEFQLKFM